MTWLRDNSDTPTLDGLLAQRPELLEKYRTFYASIWEAGLVPRRVLELCRLRVAAIHDCEAEWTQREAGVELGAEELEALRRGDFEPFDAAEQAALAVTELLPFAHHALTDEDVATVKAELGDAGCVSLINALVLFDVNCRLKLAFDLES